MLVKHVTGKEVMQEKSPSGNCFGRMDTMTHVC